MLCWTIHDKNLDDYTSAPSVITVPVVCPWLYIPSSDCQAKVTFASSQPQRYTTRTHRGLWSQYKNASSLKNQFACHQTVPCAVPAI